MKERNEEYKKYLQVLIDAEKAKPQAEQNQESLAGWTEQLSESDAAQKRSLAEKQMEIDNAIDSGDGAKIRQLRNELEQLKTQYAESADR